LGRITEGLGSETYNAGALTGVVTVSGVAIAAPNAGAQENAIQAALAFNVHAINADTDLFSWNLFASSDVFDFLQPGEPLDFSVTVTIEGADGGSVQKVVPFTIIGSNQAPEANQFTLTVAEDSEISGMLVSTDADGDALTFELVDGSGNALTVT
jgi:VCBS repeat-containing protein